MRSRMLLVSTVLLVLVGAVQADPTVAEISHREFQAVNSNDYDQAYSATDMVILEGIVLHNPADIELIKTGPHPTRLKLTE